MNTFVSPNPYYNALLNTGHILVQQFAKLGKANATLWTNAIGTNSVAGYIAEKDFVSAGVQTGLPFYLLISVPGAPSQYYSVAELAFYNMVYGIPLLDMLQ